MIITCTYLCYVYNSVTAYARCVLLFGYKAFMGISSLQLVDIALYSRALFKLRNWLALAKSILFVVCQTLQNFSFLIVCTVCNLSDVPRCPHDQISFYLTGSSGLRWVGGFLTFAFWQNCPTHPPLAIFPKPNPKPLVCGEGGVCGEGTFDDPHLSALVEKGTA